MAKPEKKKGFNIGDPLLQIDKILNEVSKYRLGSTGYSFYDIKNLKPIFAFDYLSLSGGELCFNSKGLSVEDYIGFLEGLRKISDTSYQTLHHTKNYRFHKIDFDDKKVAISRKDFKAILSSKPDLLKDEELPTLYQFDLQYVQAARVCGFLFKGVFYLVWYDRNHIIYPRN